MFKKLTQVTLGLALFLLFGQISAVAQCAAGEEEIIVEVIGGAFPGEQVWAIAVDGVLLTDDAGDDIVLQGAGTFAVCVPVGALVEVIICDTFGDGWNDGEVNAFNGCSDLEGCQLFATGPLTTEVPDCDDAAVIAASFTVGTCDAVADVSGCTDPNALNFNSCATTDDGSCIVLPSLEDCSADPVISGLNGTYALTDAADAGTVTVTPVPNEICFTFLTEGGFDNELLIGLFAGTFDDSTAPTGPGLLGIISEVDIAAAIAAAPGAPDLIANLEFDPAPVGASICATGLAAGDYTFYVGDSFGDGWNLATGLLTSNCGEIITSEQIIEDISADIQDELAFVNFSIASDATAVSGPGVTDNGDGTFSFDPASAGSGTHTITTNYTDACGQPCVATAEVVVEEAAEELVAECAATPVSCTGGFDGTATGTVSGGVAPYSYAWAGGQITQTAVGLGAGSYALVVTDAAGTQATCFAEVETLAQMELTCVGGSAGCTGGGTGTVSVSVAGGTAPYSYAWDTGETTASTNLAPGVYTVVVTDANGCTAECSAEVVEDVVAGPPSFAECDGPVNLIANGSFDDGLNGWGSFSAGFNVNPDPIGNPSNGVKIFGPFDGSVVSGITQTFPCVGGDEVCMSADMFTLGGDAIAGTGNFVEIKLEFYDAGGTILNPPFGTVLDSFTGADPVDTWINQSGCLTAPAGTASVLAVVIFVQPNFEGGAVWIDNVTLVKAGAPSPTVTFEAGDGCVAMVDIPVFTATDECEPPTITLSGDATATGVAPYGLGTYSVIYTATDADGNMATCDYNFEVVDTTPPAVTCSDFGSTGNLIVNPEFEDGTNGWILFGNGGQAGGPTEGNPPPSAFLFGPYSGPFGASGLVQNFACADGDLVCLSADIQAPNPDGGGNTIIGTNIFVEVKIEFFDAGGNIINGPFGTPVGVFSGMTEMANVWETFSGCLEAPAGTASANAVIVLVQPNFEDGAVLVDNVSFEKLTPETIDADAGDCMALVDIPDLMATDNCGDVTTTISGDATVVGPASYAPGLYIVDYLFVDMNGNESACVYAFEVVDETIPEFAVEESMECSGTALAINLNDFITNGAVGVTYEYVAADNPNTEGETTVPVAGNVITDVITNTSGATMMLTYTVTPTTANGCMVDPFDVSVMVFSEIEAEPACACALNSAGTQIVPVVTVGGLAGGSAVSDGLPYTFASDDGVFLSTTAGIGGSVIMELNNLEGGDYTITVTDNFGCETVISGTCTDCTFADEISLTDPCVCNGDQSANGAMDGTFTETVVATGPAGFNIVVGVGSTGSGVVVGAPLTGSGAAPVDYEIIFTHTDNVGYEIFLELLLDNGTTVPLLDGAGNQLSVSNVCQYPILDDPDFQTDFCATDGPLSLAGATSEIQGHEGTIVSSINGFEITSFDPAVYGPGNHTIEFTFTGDFVSNANGTVADPAIPGCETSVFETVTVHSGGQVNCNDHINLSLDAECGLGGTGASIFLEGDGNTQFFGYRILDNLGEEIEESDLPAYIGQTLQYEVFDVCTGNVCWGTVTLEDKAVPTVACDCETPYMDDGVTPNPDCTFKCYEVWDLEALESLQRTGNEILPSVNNSTPQDNCADFGNPAIAFSYSDGPNCGEQIVTRELAWSYIDEQGQTQYLSCTQNFLFDNLELTSIGETANGTWDGYGSIGEANNGDRPMFDFYTPQQIVSLPCGAEYDPASIAAFYDVDNPSLDDFDRDNETQNIIEYNEGIPYAYPYVVTAGWSGRFHAKPIDNNLCNIWQVYSDVTSETCAEDCLGNSKIARTWTILDWCDASTAEFVQTIKRVDEEGPQVSGPDHTISVDPWGCTANFEVPAPEHLLDNCDKDATWTVIGPLGVDIVNGYAIDLPKGTTTLTYLAEDCCGNQTYSSFDVTVEDNTAPTAIALQNVVIGLTNLGGELGFAKLFAKDIDNFSHDGCTDIHLEIRRPDDIGEWCEIGSSTFNNDGHAGDHPDDPDGGQYVVFCCEDLLDVDENGVSFGIAEVVLRVWDDGDMNGVFGTAGDNYNETWTTVRIEDKQAPIVVCPPDVELTCDQDFNDYTLTGVPTGFTTCGTLDCVEDETEPASKSSSIGPFVGETIPPYNPSCRTGALKRTWVCGDGTCTQWIIMRDTEEGPLEITWPDDVTADCSDIVYDEPIVQERFCELTGTSLESDTFYFEDGACFKILNHWSVINWCDYDANDTDLNDFPDLTDDGEVAGLYTHTQILKLIDTEKPTITTQDTCFAVNADCVGQGIQIWAGASDNGACGSPWLKWEAEVDMNSDWDIDYTFSSYFAPNDPFYLSPTSGDVHINLPDGLSNGCASSHRVRWTVSDGCGNETQATSFFTIEDKKKPTPYMLNLSTALMSDGSVELWAKDFDTGSFDNCAPQDFLLFTFSDVVPPQLLDPAEEDPWYDAEGVARESDYLSGDAELWDGAQGTSAMVFTEDDLEASEDGLLEVPVYVWDLCGNSDFAIVNLKLVDNGGDATANISGRVSTESGVGVVGVEMSATANGGDFTTNTTTTTNGEYMFEYNPINNDYTLSGEKNDDWLNGVTTLDILLIQRHILSIQELDSPYKMIAADASNDERISAVDMIQLRKLILGIYSELPNNDSWRFTDADAQMNSTNPWPFSEFVNVTNLDANMVEDFVGTKVGDVNGSVELLLQGESTDLRSNSNLKFNIEQSDLGQGVTELRFKSGNFTDISGFQFTLDGNVTEIVETTSGLMDIAADNVGLANGSLAMSWNASKMVSYGEGTLFTVKVKKSDTSLTMSDRVARSEAYQGAGLETINVSLEDSGLAINSLAQNEPNPWKAETRIDFSLAKAGTASLTVFDVTGKQLYKTQSNYEAGTNVVTVKGTDLAGASGVLYYKLESGEFSDTKKMILIE